MTIHAADEPVGNPAPEQLGSTSTERTRPARKHRVRRGILIGLLTLLGIVVVVGIVGSITPVPSAMLIRSVFEQGGDAAVREMEPHVPDTPLREMLDVAYADEGTPTTMDVFTTAEVGEVLPTVIWVHGGAWISGSKENVDPYLRILAAQGYTTIGVNYSLGPEEQYPTAVRQLNDALAYIDANATELGVDATNLVLAGDSAGAQLASQLTTLITNDGYAQLLGLKPALRQNQLSGLILNCGVFDMRAMAELEGLVAWGFQVSLWAYTGTKDWSASAPGATMSTLNFVNDGFPPTYVSGGNGDGLTWLQSIPMSHALRDVGVDVTTLFWPMGHEPKLPHEYQFHLDTPEAQQALDATISYLAQVTAAR